MMIFPPSITITRSACAASSMMVFQTCLNVFGAVDILPLTGVTFPFVSNGGTAMMAAWGLLAFLKATDTRQNASFAIRRKNKRKSAAQRRAEEEAYAEQPAPSSEPTGEIWEDPVHIPDWDGGDWRDPVIDFPDGREEDDHA